MFKLIEKLRSKPSDRNIRLIRFWYATILLWVLYFGFEKTTWNFDSIPRELLYMLFLLPLIGFIRSIFDPGIMRKKLWKWTQVGIGIFMILLSWFFIETDLNTKVENPNTVVSGELSILDVKNTAPQERAPVDTDFWLGFFGFWVALMWLTLTSKNITTKNERYGEKVTKIRV